MYLTRTQTDAIRLASIRHLDDGFGEHSERELLKQAFEAILCGEANEAAFSVTEAADVHWIAPGIWFREEVTMNVEHARAILAQGKKDGTYEPDIPEDDDKAVAEAVNLVELAQVAAAQHVKGPEVEILLKMAEAAEADSNGSSGSQDQPALATPPAPAPQAPAPPSPPATPAARPHPQLLPEQKAEAKAAAEAEAQAAAEAAAPPPPSPNDLSQIEPWEGYEHERVSEIKEGISGAIREYTDEELTDLLANVWAYESAHKRRLTILNQLEDVARRLQAGTLRIDSPFQPRPPVQMEPRQPAPEQVQQPVQQDSPPVQQPVQEIQEPQAPISAEPEPMPTPEPPAPAPSPPETPQPEVPVPAPAPVETPQAEEAPDDEYEQMMSEVEAAMERERLHKPSAPEEQIPDLPWDWTKISAAELQRLHGIYSSAAYYKNYLLAREERHALHCKAAADELHNALLVQTEKYDDHGKEKRVAVLEAEIEHDENIKKWRRRQRKHEVFAANHRNERDSMSKLVEALSRQEAMRDGEWQRAGGRRG